MMVFNPEIREVVKNAFEEKCFKLLLDAYQTSLSERVISLDWNENDISQQIFEKIDNNNLRLKWNISVSREYFLSKEISKSKGFADRLPRIDFRLTSISAEIEYKYFCEAKRLKENDPRLKRDYIKEGIDRYVSKKYPVGCMMGYLLEGEIEATVTGINSLLQKDNRQTEILNLTKNGIFNFYYESNHIQIGRLKHIIFDFTGIAK